MGINKFHDIPIGNNLVVKSLYQTTNTLSIFESISIDASYILYKFIMPTYATDYDLDVYRFKFYKKLLLFVKRLISYKIKIVVVFDGYNSIKQNTNVKRTIQNDKFLTKYVMNGIPNATDHTKLTIISKRYHDTTITARYDDREYTLNNPFPCYEDTKLFINLLKLLEIDYVIAKEIEAEQLAKYLCRTVLSHDTDVLMCGGVLVTICDNFGGTYKYLDGDEIIRLLKLSLDDYIKMCILLGCDFCHKTKSCGPKTVLKKLKTVRLTELQLHVFNYIKNIETTFELQIKTHGPVAPVFNANNYVFEILSLCDFNFNQLYNNVRF